MALLHIMENQDASWFGLTRWLHDVGQNWASAHTEHGSICLLSSGSRITTQELWLKQSSRHTTNDLYTCYTLFHHTMCSIGRTNGMNALPHPCITWRGRNEWLQHRTVSQAEVGINRSKQSHHLCCYAIVPTTVATGEVGPWAASAPCHGHQCRWFMIHIFSSFSDLTACDLSHFCHDARNLCWFVEVYMYLW